MTRTLVSARCALGAAAIATVLLGAPSAQAQVGNMLGGALQSGQGTSIGGGNANTFRKPELAPGIPGARTTPDRAAPTDKLATDMQPTDALFDAVNRGDIAAVREALGRGADLNAHNILGLTPVDLSVDLGHTSITFLLLSMRNAAPVPDAPRARARTVAAAKSPGEGVPAGGVHVQRAPLTAVYGDAAKRGDAPVRAAAVVPRPAAPRPVAPRPAPRPQVMAEDGGTPRPSVGFLGFGR
jgi:hypothetical protein